MLKYSPECACYKYINEYGKLQRGVVRMLPRLWLCRGAINYAIDGNLSGDELWWLGHELSDFLNLELQIIYATPKVTPLSN